MSMFVAPRIAIIGAGETGCGWATLIAAAGWPVALYDANTAAAEEARDHINDRVRRLVRLGLATDEEVARGLEQFRIGRSLLQAVNDADWIIEAGPEDLTVKQRLLEQVEHVARLAAVVSSSSSSLHASDLCARLRRPDRLLVAHPLRPVELIPVVEIVPGPLTAPTCVEDVRFWLRRLGRAPIVLQKEVKGNIIGRISAAVWRECIGLVLEGAISVEDLDRAVSMGPALAWSAGGPHLTHYLSARGRAPSMYLNTMLGQHEDLWESLATWTKLETEDQHKLIRAIERAYEEDSNALLAARDSRLVAVLNAMKRS